MKYLKAVAGGIVGSTLALGLAWVLGTIATTAYLNYRYNRGGVVEPFSLPRWTAWLVLAMVLLATTGGFWAGYRFVVRRWRPLTPWN